MKLSIVICFVLVSACRDGGVDASQPVVPTFQRVSIPAGERAQIMQEVNEPKRASKIRDAGMDPSRFGEFVGLIPAARRREFYLLLDQSPGLLLQSRKGSLDETVLQAAALSPEERAAWKRRKEGQQ